MTTFLGACQRIGQSYAAEAIPVEGLSRSQSVRVLQSLRSTLSAIAFFKEAVAYYDKLGVKVKPVMTDNGCSYMSFKAERFIQTSLREWAYARPIQTRVNESSYRSGSGALAGIGLKRKWMTKPPSAGSV